MPATETVHEAMQLTRRRQRLEAQLAAVKLERLAAVLELRSLGLSVLEVSELLDVSKGRVQQLAHEAHEAAIDHDAARCPYTDYHPH